MGQLYWQKAEEREQDRARERKRGGGVHGGWDDMVIREGQDLGIWEWMEKVEAVEIGQ